MKIRITGILLLCTVIALSLPLSSCDQNSTASDLESVSDRSPPQTQFVDVPQWATEAVAFVADREIMVGVGDNRFDSQSTITKKEVAATLYRIAGSPREIPATHISDNEYYYDDLQDTSVWYYNAALWCLNQGVVSFRQPFPPSGGCYFQADKVMTRSDVVESVYRFAYHYMKQVDSIGEFTKDGIYTRGDVGTWEEFFSHDFIDPTKQNILRPGVIGNAWRWAVKQGIIFGYEDNSLRPENPVTRAEYAAIITRFIKHFDLQFE